MLPRFIPLPFILLGVIGIGLAGLMYLLMFSCRFGYDATVCLIVSEDWGRGLIPYAASIDSKAMGMFVLDRGLMLFFGKTPAAIHGATLGINILLGITAAWATGKHLSLIQKLSVVVILLATGFLTEMQYLLTEQPTAIFGVLAYACVLRRFKRGPTLGIQGVVAGALLGVSFLFKPVAGFYGIALAMVIAIECYYQEMTPLKRVWRWLISMTLISTGFFLSIGAACLWAAMNGVLREMFLQSILVPLSYEFHSAFFRSFMTKLCSLILAFIAAICGWLYLLKKEGWRSDDQRWRLELLIFSFCSFYSFTKNQASHYLIAALPFVIPFIVSICGEFKRLLSRRVVVFAALCVCASIVPLVFKYAGRLEGLTKDYVAEDRRYAYAMVSLVRPDEYALLINALDRSPANTYWHTGLRPAWPYLSIDQPSYYFQARNAGLLLKAVQNPKTTLVSWRPGEPYFYLPRPLPFPPAEVEAAYATLIQDFEPVSEVDGFHFRGLWKRKGSSIEPRAPTAGPFS